MFGIKSSINHSDRSDQYWCRTESLQCQSVKFCKKKRLKFKEVSGAIDFISRTRTCFCPTFKVSKGENAGFQVIDKLCT